MLIDPQSVLNMARTIAPASEATRDHAAQIAAAGFDAAHAGQDYQDQGNKLAAGVEGIVTMLQSWSAASGATAEAMRQAATAATATEQDSGARIENAAGGPGPA
ncbi:hypothetical protein [Nocardia sp. BMG51109]|uniref:hypothetical protein n=1 Tax=Nocardia sp. BMG51109 TaxID=1056816 RepID=UPI000465654A|nr:hypothetical protein [Nocardia sp. BMG51109]